MDFGELVRIARAYHVPVEDVTLIALNTNGVRFVCEYNRMRMLLRLNDQRFPYARGRGQLEYYLALPINPASPFAIDDDILSLGDAAVGRTVGPTEDICDSSYPRRNGTVLNINPNSRTSCRGCEFCYTAYQVPCDRKKLKDEADLRCFFDLWMRENELKNLSHLAQVAVVTGCYDTGEEVCAFLRMLWNVLLEYAFKGQIFYLGSQVTSRGQLESLGPIGSLSLCWSLETFERRNLLRDKKQALSIESACDLMDVGRRMGFEVTFSYIVGMESLQTMESHLRSLIGHINKFPIVNTLQLHKYHQRSLLHPDAGGLEYFLESRKMIERVFYATALRPLVWEDYRSLWFLDFGDEHLVGIRTP